MIYRFVGVVAGLFVVLSPLSRAEAQTPDDAETLIRRGIELRKAHDDEGAVRAFQQAYDQVHTPRAAGQLGLAEQALGRWEDAERHVGEALRTASNPWVAKNRATLDEAIGTIQAHIGRVEILGDPGGAEVSVNGRTVGKLPLPDAVRVSAGEVDVEIRAPGFVPAHRTLTIVGGQYQRVALHLTKEATAPIPTPGPTLASTQSAPSAAIAVSASGSSQPPSQLRTVIKWSAAGVAGVGLAVGVIATIAHGKNVSAFNARQPGCADNNGKAVHADGTPAPECQGDLNAYRSDTTWAIVGFAAAGAFAATWLVLQLTEGSHPAGAHQALLKPICAPSSSGLGIGCAVRF
jgi:hypothetical protein